MIDISQLTVIHVVWEGPLRLAEINNIKDGHDYGIYALYGTHAIFGPDALLYIGQANMGTFSGRLDSHFKKWGRWEPSDVNIYLGRIGGWEPITDDEWGVMVDRSEALTIYYTSPPYNSSRIKELPVQVPTIVINHKRCHRLPRYISNLHDLCEIEDIVFRLYGTAGNPPRPPSNAVEEEESLVGRLRQP